MGFEQVESVLPCVGLKPPIQRFRECLAVPIRSAKSPNFSDEKGEDVSICEELPRIGGDFRKNPRSNQLKLQAGGLVDFLPNLFYLIGFQREERISIRSGQFDESLIGGSLTNILCP